MDKPDDTLWSDKIWESVDDSKQDSSAPEVNHQAETKLALKQSSFLLSDLFWTFFTLLNIVLFPFLPWIACCGIILVILVNVIFWITDEDDSSRKIKKMLFLIVVVAGFTYWSWKIFEAYCCGFSNFN